MGRSGSITNKQKELLAEFMSKHPDLQAGRFTNNFTFKTAQNLWIEIANILNSVPDGANKDWRQWRKTWQDLKKNVKSKVSKNKKSANATGGGELIEFPLDNFENNILSMIPQEITDGLLNVNESMINFNLQPLNTEENIDQVSNNVTSRFSVFSDLITRTDCNELYVLCTLDSLHSVNSFREVTEAVEIEEAGSSTSQNIEHNYSMEDFCSNSKVKKLTKTRRLQNSLKLSQELLNTINKKVDVMSEYYNVKKEYYEHRKQYEERKLELMGRRYCQNCKH